MHTRRWAGANRFTPFAPPRPVERREVALGRLIWQIVSVRMICSCSALWGCGGRKRVRERVLALLTVIFTELNVGEHVCAEAAPEAQGAPSYFFFSPF